jgi:hypothetical protein
MGATQNSNWYNAGENRSYPVDDAATAVDDAGRFLPAGIVVDVALAVPKSLGAAAYIGAVSAGPNVTTVILVADAPGFVPLAAVTVPGPVVPYMAYPVRPMQPGVGGWVVLGDAAGSPYSGRFSTAGQSRLLARCVRGYPDPPIASIGKEHLPAPLTGLVTLLAGQDVALAVEAVTIGGVAVTAIVVGLASPLNQDVFALYAGTCNARPETGNCPKTPLESLGGVAADCDGNVDVDFRSLVATPIPGGIALDLPIGLSVTCGEPTLPAGGSLAGVYKDRCGSDNGLASFNSSHGG